MMKKIQWSDNIDLNFVENHLKTKSFKQVTGENSKFVHFVRQIKVNFGLRREWKSGWTGKKNAVVFLSTY